MKKEKSFNDLIQYKNPSFKIKQRLRSQTERINKIERNAIKLLHHIKLQEIKKI